MSVVPLSSRDTLLKARNINHVSRDSDACTARGRTTLEETCTAEIALIGAGGHADVIASAIRANGGAVTDVFDDDPKQWNEVRLGRVVRPLSELENVASTSAIISVGNNWARKQIAQRFTNVRWQTVIHPAAWIDPSAEIKSGTFVAAGAIVQANCRVGQHVIVNTSASIDHGTSIADYAHMAPGARTGGDVEIREGVLCGINASILPRVEIGAWSILGAGAVTTGNVEPNVTVVGVPARHLRRNTRPIAA